MLIKAFPVPEAAKEMFRDLSGIRKSNCDCT